MKIPGKLVGVEFLGRPAASPGRAASKTSAPPLSKPRPVRFTTFTLRPRREWFSQKPDTEVFSAAKNDPPLVFYSLILKCIHSRNTQGLPSDTKNKTKQTKQNLPRNGSVLLASGRSGWSTPFKEGEGLRFASKRIPPPFQKR